MRSRWLALAGAVLTLALMPRAGSAQGTQDLASKQKGKIQSVYPNPSNPESRSQFTIGDDPPTCTDRKQYRVTFVVINAIGQRVATPVLEGSAGGVAGGQKIQNVLMTCGQYVGYWNGKILDSRREAASGVYTWMLMVDGKITFTQKASVVK